MACYDDNIGSINISPLSFAPTNYAFCDGSLLSISQNCALFSLLGTFLGGDGHVNFKLPDLRGRALFGTYPYNYNPSPAALDFALGQIGGAASIAPPAVTAEKPKNADDPTVLCVKPDAIQTLPPYQVVNFVISLWGVYPSRY